MQIIDHDSYLADLVASEAAKLWLTPGRNRLLRVLSLSGLAICVGSVFLPGLSSRFFKVRRDLSDGVVKRIVTTLRPVRKSLVMRRLLTEEIDGDKAV